MKRPLAMRRLPFLLLLFFALCIPFSHSLAGDNHSANKIINAGIEGLKGQILYCEHQYHRYPRPYSNPYPYPYYPPYPPPPYWRYEEYTKSPYDTLSIKQAGRITIVAQPLDARVFVDGFELKRKDDLTYEIGLLTGIHKVEVKREGYQSHSIEVLVEAGKSIPLTIELEKPK
jgi:hypothetical protein